MIISTAIENIMVVLKYYIKRGRNLETALEDIKLKLGELRLQDDINQIMAYEGNIRQEYYQCFNEILTNKDFEFKERSKRPPRDKINALISFENSMMYTTVLSEIYETNLDPRIGYLHSTNNRRFTLNLDIAEIFKPIIVDRVIFTLINRGKITANDFEEDYGGILLNDKGKRKFIEEYRNKLDSVIKHKSIGTTVSYKRIIRLEIYKLQKYITEGAKYDGFVGEW